MDNETLSFVPESAISPLSIPLLGILSLHDCL